MIRCSELKYVLIWLSSRNFFQGGQNLLLCKFRLLCYCFRTKFKGGAKFSGGQTSSGGAPPPPPPVEESQSSASELSPKQTLSESLLELGSLEIKSILTRSVKKLTHTLVPEKFRQTKDNVYDVYLHILLVLAVEIWASCMYLI